MLKYETWIINANQPSPGETNALTKKKTRSLIKKILNTWCDILKHLFAKKKMKYCLTSNSKDFPPNTKFGFDRQTIDLLNFPLSC